MKPGEYVVIQNHEEYNGFAAEIKNIDNDVYNVITLKGSKELNLKSDQVKWKKKCVCGQSGRAPFCDGSHARAH